MSEGKLFICKKDKTLYVGLWDGYGYNNICESIQYDSIHKSDPKIKFIKGAEVVFVASEKIDDICAKILKPFSKSIPIPSLMDWMKCVENFISIEKLFMFALTSKSKDYSSFMELCGRHLNRISWAELFNNKNIIYQTIKMNNREAFKLLLQKSTLNMLVYQDSDSLNNVLHLALSLNWGQHFLNRLIEKLKVISCEDVVPNVINKRNKHGQTPLLLSVNKSDIDAVESLLELGCEVTANYDRETSNILHYAVVQRNSKIVERILLRIDNKDEAISKQNKDKLTPLHLAISTRNLDTIKLILNLNIDMKHQTMVKDITLLNFAIEHGESIFILIFKKIKSIGEILSDSIFQPLPEHPIYHSITRKNLLALQTLLSHYPSFLSLKKDGITLLHYAIENKFDDGANLLVEKGQTLAIQTSHGHISILSDYHKEKPIFTEDRIGYKLTSGNVLTDIPAQSITEYKENVYYCGSIERLLINLVSCTNFEPIQNYFNKPLQPIDSSQLSLIASEHATLDVITFLFQPRSGKFNFDFKAKTKRNQFTIVHSGIYNPNETVFNLLLSKVGQFSAPQTKMIDSRNGEGQSALDLAIFDNKQNSFDLLITHGATLGIQGDGTILHFFLKSKNPDNFFLDRILTLFSRPPLDYINFQDKTGCTPLHLAVKTKNKGAYEKIMRNRSCKYDLTTKEGDNILHIAIKNGDPELFKLIIHNLKELEINVDPTKKLMNKPNNANLSPIFHALNEGNIDLFLNEPDIGIDGVGENGSSLLHYAVVIDDKHGKQIEMMKAIIRRREQLLNSRDLNNQTPLHYAVINMKLQVLECLLQKSSLDLTCQDHLGNSALHCAAGSKTTECLSAIIKHVNTQFPEKLTALLNLQNSLSYTPLYSAIQSRNVNAIQILLDSNAKLPICLSDGTITFCNTNSSRAKVPLRLFKIKLRNSSVPNFCVGFEVVRSSTWIVSDLPTQKESDLIKENRATVTEIVNVTEDDLRRFILPCHSFEPLELVIKGVQCKNNIKLSHLAASNGSLETMTFLSQQNEVSYLERDDRGYSIHHFATENENKEVLKYLCNQTKNQHPNEFKKLSGTLLHFTIKQDYFEDFKILLEESFDSDLHYTDNHEDTLLHLIVNNGRSVGYTKALLECSLLNASDYCNNKNANGHTALHLAITKNQIQNVNGILKHNPDMSIQDSEGNTALHIAIQHSTEDIITAIIQHISELSDKYQLINASNHAKHKPIHLSTLRGSPDIVELLLENNAELYAVDVNEKTIFHLAVQLDRSMRMIMVEKILIFEKNFTTEKNFIYRQDL